jgi:dipeptidyl aminopeptidase/acylaminoacyl peptidase
MPRCLALALFVLPVAAMAAPHSFRSVAMSPDGRHVAAIEASGESDAPAMLVVHDLDGHSVTVPLPCTPGPNCKPSSPTWNANGHRLAFLLAHPEDGTTDILSLDAPAAEPHRLTRFPGPLDTLRFGPAGALAVLATANAHKNVGRTEAGAAMVGEIGTAVDEQRIAVLEGDALRFVSPPDLYVYEYDWRPDGGFVGTAAPGDGDSNWWIAKLYAFDAHAARVLFAPGPREQLAAPAVSPDGRLVAFIGGWMSDFGSTGGDAFTLRLDRPGVAPVNLTAGAHATVTGLDWSCGPGLTGATLAGDIMAITRLDQAGPALWSGERTISAGRGRAVSCAGGAAAAVVSGFDAPPEIYAGPPGAWRAITQANAGESGGVAARSITWRNRGQTVQGWLLMPAGDAAVRRPMIVLVHGGPEAAVTPGFLPPDATARALLAQGWDVFEPNYRGSFGQGEAFAAASIQDLGGGDWSDVLTGVDAAERAVPVDDTRLGIMGGSYGGYMTMWAVTQTHRFRAGVSHAGVSDWLSIEGEAPQAGSDQVNFGGSVYDNAAPYLKASPIMHMRGVVTPVLITVGERDLECPMPQSQEFYTAMQALGVPADFVVYPGEGHALVKAADREDLRRRTVAWFARWFNSTHH